MFDTQTQSWTCPPQVKDLPRDTEINVTCRSCGLKWGESVRQLCETHRMGVEYVDLLEWKYRCMDESCGGMVRFVIAGVTPAVEAPAVVAVAVRPKALRMGQVLPYPIKAVVKPRTYAPPMIPASRRQLSLPLQARSQAGGH